ncbi:MAG: type II toxin-antitoxin system VapC family toxin [Candidatus Micrarchaeia archaeon]|jgi:hypothetical protein
MKVYPDANIYITYLLGQRGEELAERFFKQGIRCRFSIVASNTMFAEVAQRCGGRGIMLLQKNIDDFQKAGKLETRRVSVEETNESVRMNKASGNAFGLNDMTHALLAGKYADLFVTNDKELKKYLKATYGQKVALLDEFLVSEP